MVHDVATSDGKNLAYTIWIGKRYGNQSRNIVWYEQGKHK